jgi:hypothetical protein
MTLVIDDEVLSNELEGRRVCCAARSGRFELWPCRQASRSCEIVQSLHAVGSHTDKEHKCM